MGFRLPQFRVDDGDLAFDLAQPLNGQAPQQGRSEDVVAVGGRDPVFDQATPCDQQLLHVADCIRAGRAHLRQALYMPALVAIRFNADMKAKYQAMRAAGKPPKVAISAVMRKLAILANVLLREQRSWTPKA